MTTNTQAKLLRQFGQALIDRVFVAGNGNIYSPDENNAVMYRDTLDRCLAEQLDAVPESPVVAFRAGNKRELKKQQLAVLKVTIKFNICHVYVWCN